MRPINEIAILKKAIAGKTSAFEQLVQRYQTQVYHLCLRMTGNPDDAADMTQESFLKAWRHLGDFQFGSAFSTWLYRLASNTCLDHLRLQKRRQTLSLTVEDATGEEQVLDVADTTPSPEEHALAQEHQEALQAALLQLPAEDRQILLLRAVNDLSYVEIGRIVDMPVGTIKSRISRAREKIRKILLEQGNQSDSPSSNTQKGGCGNEL